MVKRLAAIRLKRSERTFKIYKGDIYEATTTEFCRFDDSNDTSNSPGLVDETNQTIPDPAQSITKHQATSETNQSTPDLAQDTNNPHAINVEESGETQDIDHDP